MFFAILIDFWFGKGGVAPNPEKFEPAPVALHYRLDELQNAISGMDVPRSQPGPQTVTLAGEAKKGWKQFLENDRCRPPLPACHAPGLQWNPNQ
jgi:hypothetical protein